MRWCPPWSTSSRLSGRPVRAPPLPGPFYASASSARRSASAAWVSRNSLQSALAPSSAEQFDSSREQLSHCGIPAVLRSHEISGHRVGAGQNVVEIVAFGVAWLHLSQLVGEGLQRLIEQLMWRWAHCMLGKRLIPTTTMLKRYRERK